jgi:iron complex outermembrane receptor protein
VDDKSKPAEAATISLMKAADSSLFKISVTDKARKFSFQNIPFGSYYINVSAINYAKLNSKVFELNQASLTKDIDAIVLQADAKTT